MRDLIAVLFGHYANELALGDGQTATIELVDREIFSRRMEARVNRQRPLERRVALGDLAGASQGDAEEIERLQVRRRLPQDAFEEHDCGRELALLDESDGTVVRGRRAGGWVGSQREAGARGSRGRRRTHRKSERAATRCGELSKCDTAPGDCT